MNTIEVCEVAVDPKDGVRKATGKKWFYEHDGIDKCMCDVNGELKEILIRHKRNDLADMIEPEPMIESHDIESGDYNFTCARCGKTLKTLRPVKIIKPKPALKVIVNG